MASHYAKLLGLHKKLSDVEILKLIQSGSTEIQGKKIKIASTRRPDVPFDDPYC